MEQFGVLTLGSRLKRLSDHLFAQVQDLYVQCNIPISSTYFPILRLLQKTGELSVVEIAEHLHLSHPAVSKQTTKMLKEYLLEKKSDERDHRRSSLQLSQKGLEAMARVEPVLKEMKIIIEQMTAFSSTNFMEGLDQLERQVFNGSLANKVLDRLAPFKIVTLDNQHKKGFHDLNFAWLTRHFPNQITESDLALLTDPGEYRVSKKAFIWVAVRSRPSEQDVVLGTIVLVVHPDTLSGEVMKLSVVDHCQNKGIAQTLLSHVVEFAQSKGLEILTLETASCLTTARRLYERNGFVVMKAPQKSLYERADVYMEKSLRGGL
jgi:DNA-binding MarR family transcriptional regulator/ribosomal protein S18 acetylase RimI-like enzyme